MAVNTNAPVNKSDANGVTTTFPYDFRILDAGDLLVKVGSAVKTLDTDYTVSGVGDPAGGDVTFLVAPALGVVERRRNMAFKRDTDFQNLGDLRAQTLNADQDAPVMMIQQLAQNLIDAVAQALNNLDPPTVNFNTVLQLGPTRILIPIKTIAGTTQTVDKTYESSLSLCTNAAAVAVTIRANTGNESLDFSTGCYMSFRQVTVVGQVSLLPDAGVTLNVPAGYLAKTRGVNSIITATCEFSGSNTWTLSGDLAIDPAFSPAGAIVANRMLGAAFSSTSVTAALVTGWSFAVQAGKSYRIRVLGTYQAAATTTGGTIAIGTPDTAAGTVGGVAKGAISSSAVATAMEATIYALTGTGSSLTTTGVSAINTPHAVEMYLNFVCTVAGTLEIRWASEVAASAAQLNAGSSLFVESVATV